MQAAPAYGRSSTPPADPGPVLRAIRLPAAPPHPVGREELLAAARAALRPEAGLLLTGPLGIGKSALLDTLGHEAGTGGNRVLRCAPGPDDAALPHAALIELLHPVPDRDHAHLPAHQRAVLDAALLRGSRPGDRLDRLALRLAVTATLERIARDAPLLLVLDGLERVDPISADVLAHVVRRAPDLGITVAAARRGGAPPGGERRLWPGAAVELTVPGLTDEAIGDLLDREARTPAPARLRQLLRLAAGNPLYARELAAEPGRRSGGRAAPEPHAEPGDPPLPTTLRALVLTPAADLPAAARSALLLAATAARPSLGLLRAAGVADPVADLGEAERRGLLRIAADGGLLLAHPLLAAALRADAGTAPRLAAHAALAGAVSEPVERARHLALAHPYEDQCVAGALAEAAATARSRGSADTAYELAVLAAARTPAALPGDRHRRLLAAAAHAADAGRHDDARRAADRVLAETPDAVSRVRARLTLLETAGQALDASGTLIEGGFADAAGDLALQARLHLWAAVRELLGGRTAGAAAEATRAATLAARAPHQPTGADPEGPATGGEAATRTQVDALGLLATVESMRGRPVAAESALGSALRLAGTEAGASLLRRRALLDLDADRVAEAGRRIAALAERATGSDGVEEALATLVARIRIQARAGDCAPAVAAAERCTRLLDAAGLASPLGAYAAALAQTVGGAVPRAVELARAAVAGCAADGDRLFEIRALGVLGGALLITGEVHAAAEAAEALQRARELGTAMRLADPDAVRRLADLAEALVLLGDRAEAQRVLAEAGQLTCSWPSAWGAGARAARERSTGLLLAVLGRPGEAVAALRGSAARLRSVPLPLDLARTLVGWASVERRARHRAPARTVLAEAEQLCRDRAAYPLLARIEQERERLDPGERIGDTLELTPSERRVAELVAGGATNREVAAVLSVSVKTVEGTLSRVYRKLGVRSRTGLARAATGGHV
ncbi:LuxR family transcriptional regulator [Streptacidiphilus sp. P02-A3a]|uniref:helix-turn-helix transcriptional regulator n=1 Tax=Streptacidiphilus sp. P02-A3a TaxID=2704468 RepID=UPI0015F9D773|nr:LuxR family transcriptional regulator [Streptacidiphilus sp. P02-A3a]QMU70834.1 helix-turn-helix domain-containing protein [Streptacidiphilus sp. P02-A3a]